MLTKFKETISTKQFSFLTKSLSNYNDNSNHYHFHSFKKAASLIGKMVHTLRREVHSKGSWTLEWQSWHVNSRRSPGTGRMFSHGCQQAVPRTASSKQQEAGGPREAHLSLVLFREFLGLGCSHDADTKQKLSLLCPHFHLDRLSQHHIPAESTLVIKSDLTILGTKYLLCASIRI